MNKARQLAVVFFGLIVALSINIVVTVYTAETGIEESRLNDNCVSISYIKSGIPVRDVYFESNSGEGCGAKPRIEMGDTGLGTLPFVANWTFYSCILFLAINKYRNIKK